MAIPARRRTTRTASAVTPNISARFTDDQPGFT
jgi:hypothetical protein